MPRALAALLASLILPGILACSATGSDPRQWQPAGLVMEVLDAPARRVAVTLSDVVVNSRGLRVRVLSVTNLFDPDAHVGPSQAVHEVRADESYEVGVAANGRHTLLQPRAGLTWGDVHSAADLVVSTEAPAAAKAPG